MIPKCQPPQALQMAKNESPYMATGLAYLAPERMFLASLRASISAARAACLASKFFRTKSQLLWRSAFVWSRPSNSVMVWLKSVFAIDNSSFAAALDPVMSEIAWVVFKMDLFESFIKFSYAL